VLGAFVLISLMASETQERTAYLYGVPIATSESTLTIVLNNDSQSDYSIHVDELKKGAAVLKISASGLCHTVCLLLFSSFVFFVQCAFSALANKHVHNASVKHTCLLFAP